GSYAFTLNDNIYSVAYNAKSLSIHLKSSVDIKDMVNHIKDIIRNNNVFRSKHMEVYGDLIVNFQRKPEASFDDVILDPTLKADIFDNTIYQLEELDESNGCILY